VASVKIDPADLIDSNEVAALLGLVNNRAVSTYRGRYSDFPVPIVEKGSGKCVLWLRSDVEAWARARGRRQSSAQS
jgi:predicted DNA-binding transcriptional regulator AlpA